MSTVSRGDRPLVNPDEFPKSWFIGDSSISRYDIDTMVRILPDVPSPGVHRFRVSLKARHAPEVFKEEFRDELVDALRLGQEWIP